MKKKMNPTYRTGSLFLEPLAPAGPGHERERPERSARHSCSLFRRTLGTMRGGDFPPFASFSASQAFRTAS